MGESESSGQDVGGSTGKGAGPLDPFLRSLSFIYRFVALLIIVAYREGSRDA